MNLKKIAINKERQCDILNEEIAKLRKQEQLIRESLKEIKQSIMNANAHFIGKKARCSNVQDYTFKDIICECSYVHCNDNFDPIPKFKHKGKKVDVDYYNWL